MSSTANFASVLPRSSSVLLVTKDPITTNINPTSTANTFLGMTAGSSASKVNEIVFQAGATTEAGLGYVWIATTGGAASTYFLFDTFVINAVTLSVSVPTAPYRLRKQYSDLYLPSGKSLYLSHDESGTTNQSKIQVTVSGADF
jgi:hypothetical protein